METYCLTTGELAVHNHDISISISSSGEHYHHLRADNDGSASGGDALNNTNAGGKGGTYLSTSADGKHSHSVKASIGNSGGGQSHENRMPYIVVNRWKRTA